MIDTVRDRLNVEAFLRTSAQYLGVPYRPIPAIRARSLCRTPIGQSGMRDVATPPRIVPAQL
jgi:hypothetical protein